MNNPSYNDIPVTIDPDHRPPYRAEYDGKVAYGVSPHDARDRWMESYAGHDKEWLSSGTFTHEAEETKRYQRIRLNLEGYSVSLQRDTKTDTPSISILDPTGAPATPAELFNHLLNGAN